MKKRSTDIEVAHYQVKDNGIFPNSLLPVLHYKGVLKLPAVFGALFVKQLFKKNNWSNSWKYGIFEYHHYHSITHEVLGICAGQTNLLLGGDDGTELHVKKGDVLIIPAGVAHKNLGKEQQVTCVGAYPNGMSYDINYGKVGERPQTDRNIRKVPRPDADPVFGNKGGINKYW
jgi:uncharacterized protein YjlB